MARSVDCAAAAGVGAEIDITVKTAAHAKITDFNDVAPLRRAISGSREERSASR